MAHVQRPTFLCWLFWLLTERTLQQAGPNRLCSLTTSCEAWFEAGYDCDVRPAEVCQNPLVPGTMRSWCPDQCSTPQPTPDPPTPSPTNPSPIFYTAAQHTWFWQDAEAPDFDPTKGNQTPPIKIAALGNVDTLADGYFLYFRWLTMARGGIRVNGTVRPVSYIQNRGVSSDYAATQITQNLIENQSVKFILGNADHSEAMAEVVNQTGALMILAREADPRIFANRPQVFGMTVSADNLVTPALHLLERQIAVNSLAWVADETRASQLECSRMRGIGRILGLHEGDLIEVNVQTGDDLNLKEKLRPVRQWGAKADGSTYNGAQAVFLCVSQTLCKPVISALKDLSANPILLGTSKCLDMDFKSMYAHYGEDAHYIIGLTHWYATMNLTSYGVHEGELTGLTVGQFSEMFSMAYDGKAPDYLAAAMFSSAAALVHAIESANSLEPSEVAVALRNMDVVDISGRIKFDPATGQNTDPAKLIQFQQDPLPYVVGPPEFASRLPVFPKWIWHQYKCMVFDDYHLHKFGSIELGGTESDCLECPEGMYGTLSRLTDLGGSTYMFSRCVYSGAGKMLIPHPRGKYTDLLNCTVGTYSEAHMADCVACPIGMYTDQVGSASCNPCPAGTFQNTHGASACVACGVDVTGHVTFSNEEGSDKCKVCPPKALCEKDENGLHSSFTNQDGYYLPSPDSDKLFPCRHERGQVCLAGGKCKPGQHGIACGVCDRGYARPTRLSACAECPPLGTALFYMVTGVSVVWIYTLIVSFAIYKVNPRRPAQIFPAVAKQALQHAAMMSVIYPMTRFRADSVSLASAFGWLRTAAWANMYNEASLSTECLVQVLIPELSPWKTLVIIGWLLYPVSVVVDVLGYALFKQLWRVALKLPCLASYRQHLHEHRPRAIFLATLIVVHAYFLHTRLVAFFLDPLDCVDLDDRRLLFDTNVVCGSPTHSGWASYATMGLVIFGIGVPLKFLFLVWKFKHAKRLGSPTIVKSLGFMYVGYERDCWYFDGVFLLRKLLLMSIPMVPGMRGADAQSGAYEETVIMTMLLVALIFLGIHFIYLPFDNRGYFILDRIETAMLVAVVVTLLTQVLVWSSDDTHAYVDNKAARANREAAALIVLFVVNVYFLCLLVWGVVVNFIRDNGYQQMFRIRGKHMRLTPNGIDISALDATGKKVFLQSLEDLVRAHVRELTVLPLHSLTRLLNHAFANAVYWRRLAQAYGMLAFRRHDAMQRELARGVTDTADEVQKKIYCTYKDISNLESLDQFVRTLQQFNDQTNATISAADFDLSMKTIAREFHLYCADVPRIDGNQALDHTGGRPEVTINPELEDLADELDENEGGVAESANIPIAGSQALSSITETAGSLAQYSSQGSQEALTRRASFTLSSGVDSISEDLPEGLDEDDDQLWASHAGRALERSRTLRALSPRASLPSQQSPRPHPQTVPQTQSVSSMQRHESLLSDYVHRALTRKQLQSIQKDEADAGNAAVSNEVADLLWADDTAAFVRQEMTRLYDRVKDKNAGRSIHSGPNGEHIQNPMLTPKQLLLTYVKGVQQNLLELIGMEDPLADKVVQKLMVDHETPPDRRSFKNLIEIEAKADFRNLPHLIGKYKEAKLLTDHALETRRAMAEVRQQCEEQRGKIRRLKNALKDALPGIGVDVDDEDLDQLEGKIGYRMISQSDLTLQQQRFVESDRTKVSGCDKVTRPESNQYFKHLAAKLSNGHLDMQMNLMEFFASSLPAAGKTAASKFRPFEFRSEGSEQIERITVKFAIKGHEVSPGREDEDKAFTVSYKARTTMFVKSSELGADATVDTDVVPLDSLGSMSSIAELPPVGSTSSASQPPKSSMGSLSSITEAPPPSGSFVSTFRAASASDLRLPGSEPVGSVNSAVRAPSVKTQRRVGSATQEERLQEHADLQERTRQRQQALAEAKAEVERLRATIKAEDERIIDLTGELEFTKQMRNE